MKKIVILFLGISYMVIFFSLGVAQPPPVTQKVIVEGNWEIEKDNRKLAREKAIGNAMQNSMVEVLNGLLGEDIITDNYIELEKYINKKYKKYVQSYKVMSEFPDIIENVYRVVLEVAIFKGDLKKYLAEIGLLFKGRELNRVVVIIDEKKIGESYNYTDFFSNSSIIERIFIEEIENLGLLAIGRGKLKRFVDQNLILKALNGNMKAISEIGVVSDSEVVVIGSAKSKLDFINRSYNDKIPLKANLGVKAVRSDTSELIYSFSDFKKEIVEDELHGGNLILIKIGEKAKNPLVKGILESWRKIR